MILTTRNCPSRKVLPALVKEALSELGLSLEVEERLVSTLEEARSLRFYGSPSLKLDGKDLEPGADETKEPGLG